MRTGIIVSNERIDHQTDAFGKNIEVLVAQLCEDIRSNDLYSKDLADYPVVKKLGDLIFRRLGLKVDIITNGSLAAILPFYSNRNHIFLADMLRGNLNIREQSKLLKSMEGKRGFVNLKQAELGGIYSEYEHPLWINFAVMIKKYDMTPAAITAVILHELGHAFSACYYADRTDTTNQVLANLLRTVTDHDTAHDVNYTYRELQKVTDQITKEEVDKILNGPRVVAGATWFRAVIRMVKSQLQNDKYSETSFEELADSFASRFGYGKELVLSLDKIHQDDFNKRKSMLYMAYFFDFLSVALMAGAIMVAFSTGMIGMGVYFVVLKILTLRISGDDMKDMTYDELIVRYKRIRQDTIDLLKDRSLKPAQIKAALEAINNIDASLKSTSSMKPLYTRISNIIFPDAREASNAMSAEQLMETLASNDLFIQAANFKTN